MELETAATTVPVVSSDGVLVGNFPVKRLKSQLWVFPKIGVPQNGWFIMENPIKMDDLGVPLFSETSSGGLCNDARKLKQHHQKYFNCPP